MRSLEKVVVNVERNSENMEKTMLRKTGKHLEGRYENLALT